MKSTTLLFISLLALYSTPSLAQAYKCAVGNKMVFSDSPCSGDARKSHEAGAAQTASSQTGGPKETGAKSCRVSAQQSIAWNDAESIRIGEISGGEMEVLDFADSKIGARRYYVHVNAKNSYGAYSGAKPVTCFTSQDGVRILKMDSTSFDSEKTR